MIFGVNLSTAARPTGEMVASARLAEALAFDFVSSSDHPASTIASNEVWTQLAWVAATTSTIRVAPRVLGAPFRNPVLVAKMAETLHRLSDGRLILGLGAGGWDQELHALGVPRSVSQAKVAALEEATQVIRGVWGQPKFSFHGVHHLAEAVTIEPRPATTIPIWLGTFGPRALSITGSIADGWLPTLGYAPVDELAGMLARVRTASVAAGRTHDAVQAILNVEVRVEPHQREHGDALVGPAAFLVERLSALGDIGFDGFNFIVVGDSTDDQHRALAADVVPALTGDP